MKLRLRELREDNNFSQKDIAKVLNCTQGAYSRYETGSRLPTVRVVVKLADFYGVRVNYLLGLDDVRTE